METSAEAKVIIPVILAGGSGTRLWPVSRRLFPKQFLTLFGEHSLLQETAKRVGSPDWQAPWVICHGDTLDTARAQLAEIGLEESLLLIEPAARNTAPAIAAAAALACQKFADAVLFVLPADHVVRVDDAYRQAVAAGLRAALRGKLVTFGIEPHAPETGYGYIKGGAEIEPFVHEVERFVEKPSKDDAIALLTHGGYYWNSGMFMFRADQFLKEIRTHAADVAEASESAISRARVAGHNLYMDEASFSQAPSISIDYAVMEKTANAAVVASSFDWSDIGSWDAVYAHSGGDGDETIAEGPVFCLDSEGSLVRSTGPFVGTIGAKNMIVLATPDSVLVAERARAQDIKKVVTHLKEMKRDDLLDLPCQTRGPGGTAMHPSPMRSRVTELTAKAGGGEPLRRDHGGRVRLVVTEGRVQIEMAGGDDPARRMLGPGDTVLVPEGVTFWVYPCSETADAVVLEVAL